MPSAIPCSLSPLISCIHSCLFSYWRSTVSSKFFGTLVPSVFITKFVLPRHTRCVLSYLRCDGHTLLLSSYLSRIDRIENPSCSVYNYFSEITSHLILHCPATDSAGCAPYSLATPCLSTISGLGSGELPDFLSSIVFRHAPIPRKGLGNNNNNNNNREDTKPAIDIIIPNAGFEQNKEIKQLRTSAVTTDKQRESREPMTADNTNDIGKLSKRLKKHNSSSIENDIGK